MCHYEGIHSKMNGIVYYSNTGQSKSIAQYMQVKTGFELYDIFALPSYEFDIAILVFPVHCQSIPKPVLKLLSCLRANSLILIATYGRMCCGNVLYEIQRLYSNDIIAAAYVPTKHSYLSENGFNNYSDLDVLLAKINVRTPINISKRYKNPLSNFCKRLRSRLGVRLYKDGECDNCGVCNTVCNNNAIVCGKTNVNCIRCLKCVNACPRGALSFALSFPMRLYLGKKKQDELIIQI